MPRITVNTHFSLLLFLFAFCFICHGPPPRTRIRDLLIQLPVWTQLKVWKGEVRKGRLSGRMFGRFQLGTKGRGFDCRVVLFECEHRYTCADESGHCNKIFSHFLFVEHRDPIRRKEGVKVEEKELKEGAHKRSGHNCPAACCVHTADAADILFLQCIHSQGEGVVFRMPREVFLLVLTPCPSRFGPGASPSIFNCLWRWSRMTVRGIIPRGVRSFS